MKSPWFRSLIALGLLIQAGWVLAQTAPPIYADAKSRASGQVNLNPPPPGRNRLSGLYATQDSDGSIGPGGVFMSSINWRFYYFLPNGFVYLGAKDAGLEQVNCTEVTVNKYGDAVCTTYSADNDQIRIGMQNPTRFKHKGEDIVIGDYTFELIPKASNLRLGGSYDSFSAGTSAASSADITFSKDGRFTASSFVGVSVDTNAQLGSAQQSNRVSVSGSSAKEAQGTYKINGYTLELNYSDGRQARAFFARVAGDSVIRIGSRPYTRK